MFWLETRKTPGGSLHVLVARIAQQDKAGGKILPQVRLRIAGQNAQLFAGSGVQFNEAVCRRTLARSHDQFLPVLRKADDDIAAIHLSQKGRLLKGNLQQITPWRFAVVADADHRLQIVIESSCRADHKIWVSGPADDVARILRIHYRGARMICSARTPRNGVMSRIAPLVRSTA